MSLPLTIELVPRTAWWSNVRSNVSRKDWEKCKAFVKERSGGCCEVCGGKGTRWPVECHEIWEYDEETHTQYLLDLIALCPTCHQVKHFGRSMVMKGVTGTAQLLDHLCKVNGWPSAMIAEDYIMIAFDRFERMSKVEWKLDVTWLERLGIELPRSLDRESGPREQ